MFDELREEMWGGATLRHAFTAKVPKFLLATGELMQPGHFNETPANVDDDEGQALGEDGW